MWSAGVCLFTLLAMALPFGGSDRTDQDCERLRHRICSGEWDVKPECSEEAADLTERMLCVEPADRITLRDVCAHRWLGGASVPLAFEVGPDAFAKGRSAPDVPDARDSALM